MAEPDYRPRSAWTSTARGGALLTGDELEWLVDHYTGRPASSPYGVLTVAQEAAIARAIRADHMSRGWSDSGYQAMVTQAARVWDLRGISRVPAAHASASNPRANHRGGALLWLLAVDEEPSDAMIRAAQHFRREVWLPRWPRATGRIGHRDVPGAATSCPGMPVRRLLADGTLLLPPTGGTPTPPTPPTPPAQSPAGWLQEVIMSLSTLRRGSRGAPVRRLQGLLHAAGRRDSAIDGDFGPATDRAVRAVQQQARPVDGIVGRITWTKLIKG